MLLSEAGRQGATYALLPENFAFFGSEPEKQAKGEAIAAQALRFLSETAAKLKMTVTGGGLPLSAGNGKFYNAAVTYGPDGGEIHRYDKLHLFDVAPGDNVTYQESRGTHSGTGELSLIALPPFTFGMTICYDVRFAYLHRALAQAGAKLLTGPAAFTVPRNGSCSVPSA